MLISCGKTTHDFCEKIAFFRQIDTITWFVKNDTTNSVDAIKNSIIRNKLSVSINTNHNHFRNLTEFMHYRLRRLRNKTLPSYTFLIIYSLFKSIVHLFEKNTWYVMIIFFSLRIITLQKIILIFSQCMLHANSFMIKTWVHSGLK